MQSDSTCASTTSTRARGTHRRCCCVHGNPTWSYLWRHQLRDLPARGHRCVALDHMGFGRSDKPPHLSAYSLRAHIDNALAL